MRKIQYYHFMHLRTGVEVITNSRELAAIALNTIPQMISYLVSDNNNCERVKGWILMDRYYVTLELKDKDTEERFFVEGPVDFVDKTGFPRATYYRLIQGIETKRFFPVTFPKPEELEKQLYTK